MNLIKIISWISSLIYCVLKRNATPYDPHHFQKQQTKCVRTGYKQTHTNTYHTISYRGSGQEINLCTPFHFSLTIQIQTYTDTMPASSTSIRYFVVSHSFDSSACGYAKYNINSRNSILHFILHTYSDSLHCVKKNS